jgi:hypothetical protein
VVREWTLKGTQQKRLKIVLWLTLMDETKSSYRHVTTYPSQVHSFFNSYDLEERNQRATGVRSRQRQRIFPLASVSRPALGPTQSTSQWVPVLLSPGVQRGRGVTLPSLVSRRPGATNEHIYICINQITDHAYCLIERLTPDNSHCCSCLYAIKLLHRVA